MMNVELIFKIAGFGIVLSVINSILTKMGKEDYAMLASLLGVVVVIGIVAKEISELFNTIKTMFNIY